MTRQQFIARFCATARAGIDTDGPTPPRRRGDSDLNPGFDPKRPPMPAAVLIPVVEHPSALTLLFTRRTDHLPDHAGQVSFPGGRIEPGDASPEDAALRETEEEIGLDRRRVEVLGRLDEYVTRTGFAITPVVGFVRPPLDLTPAAHEVAEAFEVPLAFLLDPANQQWHERVIDGRDRHFHAWSYGDHFIWGATAGMLINLCQRLGQR